MQYPLLGQIGISWEPLDDPHSCQKFFERTYLNDDFHLRRLAYLLPRLEPLGLAISDWLDLIDDVTCYLCPLLGGDFHK